LRKKDAKSAEAKGFGTQGLQPETQWWLVNRNKATWVK
jgi:hypothetical protein